MGEDIRTLHESLAKAVVEMDEDRVAEMCQTIVEIGADAYKAIEMGLSKGMEKAGRLFEKEEYFVPELLMCADAMNVGLEILTPHIKTQQSGSRRRIVIGVVEGDTHDIGKNLVRLMLGSAGFDVIDLGRDVPPEVFVQSAIEQGAQAILLSSLMTTTMERMRDVVALLEEKGIRSQYKVVVGGGPVSQRFADQIGADGYGANANEAVRLAKRLLNAEETGGAS
jgi:Predicted cobalamin binding protein